MADTNANTGVMKFEYEGREYEVNKAAIGSIKVQRAMAYDGVPERMREVWDAIDLVFCGKTSEYMDALSADPMGPTAEQWTAFFQAAMEAVAKN